MDDDAGDDDDDSSDEEDAADNMEICEEDVKKLSLKK